MYNGLVISSGRSRWCSMRILSAITCNNSLLYFIWLTPIELAISPDYLLLYCFWTLCLNSQLIKIFAKYTFSASECRMLFTRHDKCTGSSTVGKEILREYILNTYKQRLLTFMSQMGAMNANTMVVKKVKTMHFKKNGNTIPAGTLFIQKSSPSNNHNVTSNLWQLHPQKKILSERNLLSPPKTVNVRWLHFYTFNTTPHSNWVTKEACHGWQKQMGM